MDSTVTLFQRSFFSMTRLSSLPWAVSFYQTPFRKCQLLASESLQESIRSDGSFRLISDILDQTCLHPLCKKFPPSVRYRRLFLSELIKQQEGAGSEPLDQLYEALAEVLLLGSEDGATEVYKNYLLPDGGAVTLLENVALISEGTTGLVTWTAGQYLAEWALDHQGVFSGRRVLELGSGVGLTGIAVCLLCGPSTMVFSDCHPGVLQKLRANVQLNGLSLGPAEGEEVEGEKSPEVRVEGGWSSTSTATAAAREEEEEEEEEEEVKRSPEVRVEHLDWSCSSTAEQIEKIRADVVIAADVVYDPEVAENLVMLISKILRRSGPEVYICSTIRNMETYGGFKENLRSAGIGHEVITGPVRHVFPYDRTSALELIQLRPSAPSPSGL